MKIVILDSVTLGADIDLSPITALGDVIEHKATPPEDVAARLSDADVAVLNKVKLNKDNLAGAKKLKLICVAATGYDNIDVFATCPAIQPTMSHSFRSLWRSHSSHISMNFVPSFIRVNIRARAVQTASSPSTTKSRG